MKSCANVAQKTQKIALVGRKSHTATKTTALTMKNYQFLRSQKVKIFFYIKLPNKKKSLDVEANFISPIWHALYI